MKQYGVAVANKRHDQALSVPKHLSEKHLVVHSANIFQFHTFPSPGRALASRKRSRLRAGASAHDDLPMSDIEQITHLWARI